MPPILLVAVITAGVGIPVALGAGMIWLANSWKVAEDDDLAGWTEHKGSSIGIAILGHHFGQWLKRKPRQLGYRRDKRGRFRRIHRW